MGQLQEGQQSRIVRNLVARLSASDLEELNAFLGRTVGARARRVLEQVRRQLPTKEHRYVRSSIVDEMEEAKVERLSDPESAVPAEVRALLEKMVAQ